MKKIRPYLLGISLLLPWIVYFEGNIPKSTPINNFPKTEMYLTALILALIALFYPDEH